VLPSLVRQLQCQKDLLVNHENSEKSVVLIRGVGVEVESVDGTGQHFHSSYAEADSKIRS
jgi:hypothetical protein